MRVRVDAQGSRRPSQGVYVCGVFALQQLDGGHLHAPLSYATRLKTRTAFGIWHLPESWKMGIPFRSFTKFPLPTIADSYGSAKVQNSLPPPTVCSAHRTPSQNSRCLPCKPPKDPTETAPDCIRTCLRGESWVISLDPVAARAGKQSHNIIIEFG